MNSPNLLLMNDEEIKRFRDIYLGNPLISSTINLTAENYFGGRYHLGVDLSEEEITRREFDSHIPGTLFGTSILDTLDNQNEPENKEIIINIFKRK